MLFRIHAHLAISLDGTPKLIPYGIGTPVTGDPRAITLDQHAVIQLDLGGPRTTPQPYTFPRVCSRADNSRRWAIVHETS